MKLVIVSHVRHYLRHGLLYAYAPYAREIEVWAELFDQVIIAAPLCDTDPAGDCDPIDRLNIQIAPQRELGGESVGAKIELLCSLPIMAWELSRALRQGDAIHVRCPGNLGLLGAVLAPSYSKNLVAKFAGQWNSSAGDPWSVRLQRAVLSSRRWHGPVTVYGNWPNLPKHVIPFFSAALTTEQTERGSVAAQKRTTEQCRNILFVGRLTKAKNVDILLRALARLREEAVPFHCRIAGDGPERSALESLASELGLRDSVDFIGGVSFARMIELYERSGILVLASQTEGWPKAITEAMAFGLIAIGSNLGVIPQMLGDGRGFAVPPRDPQALAEILQPILVAPERFTAMRSDAVAWAQSYSLDALREALRALLARHWGLPTLSNSTASTIAPPAFLHE